MHKNRISKTILKQLIYINMNLRKISFAVIFSIIAIAGFSQGYEIKVKLKDFPNDTIILAHHFASSIHPDDTLKLNSKGEGVFKGKEKLAGGMYLVFLPTKSYFDIFIDKDQSFSIENDTLDMVNNFKSVGSKDNEVFYDYQRFIKAKNAEATVLREKQKTANEKEKNEIAEKLKNLNKEVVKKQDDVINNHHDVLFAIFLKATREVEVPKKFLNEKNRVKKELIPDYLYFFRMHFWDNFDFGDARLLRTPIYENKMKLYIEKIVPQMPDTMNEVVDYIMARVIPTNAKIRKDYVKPEMEKNKVYNNPKSNDELLRYVLITLHNHLASSQVMGMEEAMIYETYYYYTKYAVWSNDSYIKKLKEDAATKTPLFIGRTAQNLTMSKLPNDKKAVDNLILELEKTKEAGKVFSDKYKEDLKLAKDKKDSTRIQQEEANNLVPLLDKFSAKFGGNKALYDVKAKYTLVWFWEQSCSHCRKATPQLVEVYGRLKHLGFKIYAVSIHSMTYDWEKTIKENKKWLEFVNDHNMHDFNNVYDPYHSTNFRELYDINSSPVPYLLDKDKKIIAKRISTDQIVSVLLDEELEEIHENSEGKVRIDKFKAFISHKEFGLRELDFIKQTLSRVLEDKEKETILKFIEKKTSEKEKSLETELKLKLKTADAKKLEVLKAYADTFFNTYDIDFLIEKLKENLSESKEDKKIIKHFENRKKYKLE